MTVVKNIEFNKLIPFVFCENNYAINNDWIIEFNTVGDNDVINFLMYDHKNLYYPIVYNNKIEFYLCFETTCDRVINLTYSEFKIEVLDNEDLPLVIREELRDSLKDFRSNKLCFCIEYLGTRNWKDCVDIKNCNPNWGTAVVKHKLLYNKYEAEKYSKKVKVTIDGKDYIGHIDIGLDLYLAAVIHVILTVSKEDTESNLLDYLEAYKIFDSYILCTENTDRYMMTLGNDKHLFGVFGELNLEVL